MPSVSSESRDEQDIIVVDLYPPEDSAETAFGSAAIPGLVFAPQAPAPECVVWLQLCPGRLTRWHLQAAMPEWRSDCSDTVSVPSSEISLGIDVGADDAPFDAQAPSDVVQGPFHELERLSRAPSLELAAVWEASANLSDFGLDLGLANAAAGAAAAAGVAVPAHAAMGVAGAGGMQLGGGAFDDGWEDDLGVIFIST
eukprot:jgi/Ulvmu1/5522/UM023_0058.1